MQIYQFVKKFKNEESFHSECQVKSLFEGKRKILNIKYSKIFEKNQFKGLILSIDDITELVSAQKKAAWSNVARYIAHEIKNPLTPIKLSAQRIDHSITKKSNYNKSNSFKECVDTIIRQVSNIEKLVSEFSNFARMPQSKIEKVNLEKIIQTQINTQKIANKNVKFNLFSNEKDIYIHCDFDQVSRLFMNILKNSVESASKKKKEISVNLSKEKNYVLIDVDDNGSGFDGINTDTFFEPYMTKKINGTGLGLAICKKIVEDHNGEIELLESSRLGGARVRIKLYINIK